MCSADGLTYLSNRIDSYRTADEIENAARTITASRSLPISRTIYTREKSRTRCSLDFKSSFIEQIGRVNKNNTVRLLERRVKDHTRSTAGGVLITHSHGTRRESALPAQASLRRKRRSLIPTQRRHGEYHGTQTHIDCIDTC